MGMYTFTGPDGRSYDVNGPQGSTQEEAFAMLQGHINQPAPTLKAATKKPPIPFVTTSGAAPDPAAGAPAPDPGKTKSTTSGTPNINAGASGNPLDVLLAGRNPWGSLGGLLYGSPGANMPQATSEGGDPIYGEGFIYGNDPRYNQAYNDLKSRGLVQLRSTNIGGPGEAIDPSKVTYDPQYGLVTPASNVAAPDSKGDWIGPAIMAALAGGVGLYAAGAFGATGVAAEGLGAVAPGMEAQAALESQLLNAGIVPGTEAWTSALSAAGFDPAAAAALPDPAAGAPPGDLDLSPLPGTPAGTVTPLIDGPSPGLLDGLDLSPIGTTPAGNITPLFPGPFDPAAAADALTPSLTYDINNYPAGPDPFMPPDTPPPDFTLQPPPEIPGTDLMPAIPGSSFLDGLTTPGNLLKAGSLAASLYGATRKPAIPDALKNNTTTQDNKPILDQARQILLANGQPTPDQRGGIDAIIDRQIREAKAALTQRAINSGMGADSMVTQQQINTMTENANGLRAQLYMQQAQQNINNALKEWGLANSQDLAVQQLIAEYELQADKDSQLLAANIAKAFGWLSSVAGG